MDFDIDLETITPVKQEFVLIGGTGGLTAPTGTTSQRPVSTGNGTLRYNSSTTQVEFYQNNSWVNYLPVVITSPVTNQIVSYNGTNWVNTNVLGSNASGNIGVTPTGGGTVWTLVSGNRYTANFVHNLGTQNVVITIYDTNDNSVVTAQTVTTPNSNTVTVVVTGNTKTLKVVVVANGQSIVAGGSTPSSVVTALNGSTISTAATTLNFTGQAVNVTASGATTTIAIGSRFVYFANSLDTPNNPDYAINALAPVTTDPTYASLNVRSFSNTVEQGVAFLIDIPQGATTVTYKIRGRAQTAPVAASVVQMRVYYRLIPNNSAIGAWVGPIELPNISIPTNANFQYYLTSGTLAAAGLVAGNTYQIELTRRVTGVTGTNLPSNFYMVETVAEFA